VVSSEKKFPHRKFPCGECPFRRDTPPGKFTVQRYEALRETVGEQGNEVPIGAPVFACHLSTDTAPLACAGWLAVAGIEHIGMRAEVICGRLEPEALAPRGNWPSLYGSYDEMARAQGRRQGVEP
jgi:hypothetical protein